MSFELVPRPPRLIGRVRVFVFRHGMLMVSGNGRPVDGSQLDLPDVPRVYLGRLHGCHCQAVELAEEHPLPPEVQPGDLRRLLTCLDEYEFAMASRAAQVLVWRRDHRFCSRCGTPTREHERDLAMVCQACDYAQYPRITPCVIMLVTRGREALLARSPRFRVPMFSCLAGFMEAGETAEQAVAREVLEETGIRVGNLRYHGSQSWPFPHSLMLAFRAEWESGEIVIDPRELAEARWFRPEELPSIPPPGSIARSLIDSWLAEAGA